MTTIVCRLFKDGTLTETGFDPELISDHLKEPDALVWVDLEGPTKESLDMLGREFGFHELALEDSLHSHQRPKVESFGANYYFLVAYGLTAKDGELQCHELSAFVARNYLVTVRKEPMFDLTRVVERWDIHAGLAREGGGFLLYILLDEIVDGYFDALDHLEDRIEEIEGNVLGPAVGPQAQHDIIQMKRRLLQFRRWVSPLREVLDALQRQMVDVVTPALEPYYRDVYDHVLRSTDFVDNLREVLGTSLDAYQAVISHRLNEVVKQLTAWASIILVPTLIAGIYGMNFVHMPELHWLLGYPFALGLMMVAAALLFRSFKKRDWL